jgi:UDP-glucose 4-epimerase
MRLLITGGAGFIGCHLAEACLKQNWSVTVLDDLSTGTVENIEHLAERPGFTFVAGSVLDRPLVSSILDGCDLVFHLAAAVGVRLIVEDPVRTMAANVHGAETVLAAATRNRTPVFLASTSEVYGKSAVLPFREDADLVLGPTTKARWSYAASKAFDEYLGMAYWSHAGLPVTVVRFFNTVGPRQTGRYGMVLPRFVGQALRGEPITVFGSGEQRRCFGYVGDVVESLVRLAQTPGVAGEVINIGNDREITINELAALVKAASESSSPIVHVPYEDAYGPGFEDMTRRVPSLEKLERLTGRRPETPIETIVQLVVEQQRMQASAWSLLPRRAAGRAARAAGFGD